jgi:hypothetical protein
MTQVICKCGNLFPAARSRLGYTTCLSCGDKQAHGDVLHSANEQIKLCRGEQYERAKDA